MHINCVESDPKLSLSMVGSVVEVGANEHSFQVIPIVVSVPKALILREHILPNKTGISKHLTSTKHCTR